MDDQKVLIDDLAALGDVTGPEILEVLFQRFRKEQYYTYFGDFLLYINPCHNTGERESQLGLEYRNSKPLEELPPHVLGVAHRAYRMLRNDVTPQTIFISGSSGSGKSEAARLVISQLLREARLSPLSGIGPRIILAQHILTPLITASTRANPSSTRGIKMATLYFRSEGQLMSAQFHNLCCDRWHLLDRPPGSGAFNIFYHLLAGLSDRELQLYYLVDNYRLLDRKDGSPLFPDEREFNRHAQMFDIFMEALAETGVDTETRNYAGEKMSAILAVLTAILHIHNLDITTHAQSGQPVISNHHELRAVGDLLGVRPEDLANEIMSTTGFAKGEMVRMACNAQQAAHNRDTMVVELHRRLLSAVTSLLNRALAPNPSYGDPGPLTPISVVDSTAQEPEVVKGGLETFLRNMAAERLEYHLHDVIFRRDAEACERERIQPYKIKFADNTDLIAAVFDLEFGILNKITAASLNPHSTPETLVSSMDNDKPLRKTGCYVSPSKGFKDPDVFYIKHTGLGQVTYSARDFLSKNRSRLSESSLQLLRHSANPLCPLLASVDSNDTGLPSEMTSSDEASLTRSFQADLRNHLQTLDNCQVHYIRCIKPNVSMATGELDTALVTNQLKEACIVETTRQRKFGNSTCMHQEQFLRSFREIAFSPFATVTQPKQACQAILNKAGLTNRGVTLTSTSVFLRYWHVRKLHQLKEQLRRSVTLVQALVRGFLDRMRLKRRRMLPWQRSRQGNGNWRSGNGHPQAGLRRHGFERESRSQEYYNQARQPYPTDNDRGFYESLPPLVNGASRVGRRDNDLYENQDFLDVAELDSRSFYDEAVGKVLYSMDSLDPYTWVKLIYMERGKQVAKVYAQSKSVIVDGSFGNFDGERFGIGSFRNPERDEETAYYRASIVEGIRLKREADGSILACRLCDQPVVVKGLDSSLGCFSQDVLLCQGQLPFEKTIKIFDIKEFKSRIALELRHNRYSKRKMQRACALGLSFGRDDVEDLQTPCWICVINVKALAELQSGEIVREAQLYSAALEMTSPEQEINKMAEDDAKKRHGRDRWARVNQREHLEAKEQSGRHIRQQLRAKGLNVGQHVSYSWTHNRGKEKATVEALHQWMDPGTGSEHRGSRRHSDGVRGWAKVETAVREQRNRIRGEELPNPGYN